MSILLNSILTAYRADAVTTGRARMCLLSFLAVLSLICGCGSQFELPPIPPPIPLPEPGFNLKTIWFVDQPGDLAIFGSYVFVIEDSRQVTAYYSQHAAADRVDLINNFNGLFRPTRLSLGSSGDTTFVVVADSADMHCKIYHWQGGSPLYSFTDTTWTNISGIAADDELNIYVSDSHENLIKSYDRWGNLSHTVSAYGTGSGYVINPNGLDVTKSAGGQVILLLADTGKHWVQRLLARESYDAAIEYPIGLTEDELLSPLDVTAGDEGQSIMIADSGHSTVLKYRFEGTFADTVYANEKDTLLVSPPILQPRFITSQGPLVLISDTDGGRIVIMKYLSN
jgi:hypothetical protein